MSPYIAIFVWLAFIAVLMQMEKTRQLEKGYLHKEEDYKASWLLAVLTFVFIVFWAAFRSNISDTGAYTGGFLALPNTFEQTIEYCNTIEKDKGYYYFEAFLHLVIKDNAVGYLATIALIQAAALLLLFKKYSVSFVFSVFIFVASSDIVSYMFNGIRQFTAVAITLFAAKWLFKKQYLKYILAVLFAAQFHQSALIMLPILVVVQGQAWNKKTILAIILTVAAVLLADQFTDFLSVAMADTQYGNAINDWQSFNDDGTNPLRVLLYSVPAILAFIGRKRIKRIGNPNVNVLVNLSVITSLLYLISMVTSGIYMGRLPIYCSVYSSCILLPWEIKNLFTPRSAKIVTICAIVGYLAFYYYQVSICYGLF